MLNVLFALPAIVSYECESYAVGSGPALPVAVPGRSNRDERDLNAAEVGAARGDEERGKAP